MNEFHQSYVSQQLWFGLIKRHLQRKTYDEKRMVFVDYRLLNRRIIAGWDTKSRDTSCFPLLCIKPCVTILIQRSFITNYFLKVVN